MCKRSRAPATSEKLSHPPSLLHTYLPVIIDGSMRKRDDKKTSSFDAPGTWLANRMVFVPAELAPWLGTMVVFVETTSQTQTLTILSALLSSNFLSSMLSVETCFRYVEEPHELSNPAFIHFPRHCAWPILCSLGPTVSDGKHYFFVIYQLSAFLERDSNIKITTSRCVQLGITARRTSRSRMMWKFQSVEMDRSW